LEYCEVTCYGELCTPIVNYHNVLVQPGLYVEWSYVLCINTATHLMTLRIDWYSIIMYPVLELT